MVDVPEVDPTFDYQGFPLPIHIIGVGGIGSWIGSILARGGYQGPLHLWDGDIVEAKNLRNQAYEHDDVDKLKVEALSAHIHRWRGAPATQHAHFVTAKEPMSGAVFLCVDSMGARRAVWQDCIKGNEDIELFIELRMDGVNITVHTLHPADEGHQQDWERYSSYTDDQVVNMTTGCGGPTVVLPSAFFAASLATWQMMRYAAIKAGGADTLDNQIQMGLRPVWLEKATW